MILWLEVIVVLLLILLNALFAVSEMALVSVNRARLSVLEQQGVKGAARARHLAEDPQRFLPTVQVGITLISILSGVFGGAHVAEQLTPSLEAAGVAPKMAGGVSLALVVVAITYLTLVLGELVPKQFALREPERIAARVAPFLSVLAAAVGPFVWILGRSSGLVLRLLGGHRRPPQSVTEEELKALLAEGEESGVIETQERGMIERVLRLADKPVRAIMTPRTDLDWIDRTDTPEEIIRTVIDAPHSRLIVCDGAVDNPVGVVWTKELLNMVLRGEALSIASVLRQPAMMPDTVTALDALERLRSDPLALALVMDEYGGFEGLVTAVDVLHAITGEPDETRIDDAAPVEGVFVLDGMMPVDEAKSRLRLPDLPAAGSYHTLGGLLLALLRRVPRAGDRIVFGGWRFEVMAMEGRRVDRVRASREAVAEG